MMKDGYISTFINGLRSSDSLVLLPIYYAGGTAAKDISSEDLAVGIREAGRNAIVIQDRNELLDRLPAADAYVVLGARDDSLSGLAAEIANRLKY
jgi:UDP-N-acetylmuramate--alanine ligase